MSWGAELAVAKGMRWLVDDAVPLWLAKGYDNNLRIFYERLDLQGRPIHGLPRRLMVQCRQVYVLSHLTVRGATDQRNLIRETWAQVEALYRRTELPYLWAFSINDEGDVVDAKCDTYSLTFVLLALAWLYRLWPNSHWLELADEILALIDGPLAAPAGCVIDCLPSSDGRLHQNPNMHLMEACLMLYEAARRPQDLARAGTIKDALTECMLWRAHMALPEEHDSSWNPEGIENNWFEPGHHFEWVWLLRRYARYSTSDVDADVRLLLSRALTEGVDQSCLVVERVDIRTGTVVGSRRSWGTCEYIKACVAQVEAVSDQREQWSSRAGDALEALESCFLGTQVPGLWCDRIDQDGVALSIDVPASSLYHFTLALLESERVLGRFAETSYSPVQQPAVFFDRDGVLNVDTGYPVRAEDIQFMPGAFDAVRHARACGFMVVVVSNQSAVSRGYATESEILQLHRWMSEQFVAAGAPIDAWYHCPFHDKGPPSVYVRLNHHDRKPNPGMLLRAALDLNIDLAASYMIGDKPSDIDAGIGAGVRGCLTDGLDIHKLVVGLLEHR